MLDRHPVQMATILIDQLRNEWWPPARKKIVVSVEGAQAREERIDDPQPFGSESQIMTMNTAGCHADSIQEATIECASWREYWCDLVSRTQKMDLATRTNRDAVLTDSHSHDLVKRMKREQWLLRVAANNNEFASLICRQQHRSMKRLKQVG